MAAMDELRARELRAPRPPTEEQLLERVETILHGDLGVSDPRLLPRVKKRLTDLKHLFETPARMYSPVIKGAAPGSRSPEKGTSSYTRFFNRLWDWCEGAAHARDGIANARTERGARLVSVRYALKLVQWCNEAEREHRSIKKGPNRRPETRAEFRARIIKQHHGKTAEQAARDEGGSISASYIENIRAEAKRAAREAAAA
jgi:hypothetical protein